MRDPILKESLTSRECVIYCRVSTKQQVKGDGLRRQIQVCLDEAERLELIICGIFSEYGSDFKGKFLKARNQAEEVAKSRDCYLMFEAVDRISRNCYIPDCKLMSVWDGLVV